MHHACWSTRGSNSSRVVAGIKLLQVIVGTRSSCILVSEQIAWIVPIFLNMKARLTNSHNHDNTVSVAIHLHVYSCLDRFISYLYGR
jgi:hypothetical protein